MARAREGKTPAGFISGAVRDGGNLPMQKFRGMKKEIVAASWKIKDGIFECISYTELYVFLRTYVVNVTTIK